MLIDAANGSRHAQNEALCGAYISILILLNREKMFKRKLMTTIIFH